ncbi:T9SS C-terminal target domain-containing protein, partial [Bifidobacterium pseudolongum subsp. globosum]
MNRWTKGVAVAFALTMPFGSLPVTASAAPSDIVINEANFPNPTIRNLVSDHDLNRDGILDDDENEKITGIYELYSNIDNLKGIEYLKNLRELSIHSDSLFSVNLSGNPLLEGIWIGAPLNSIDLSNQSNLKVLELHDNNIKNLDVSHNIDLEYLWLWNTKFSSINLSKNVKLRELHMSDNSLSNIIFPDKSPISLIYLDNNNIENLDLTKFPMLVDLDLRNNHIKKLVFSNNTDLKSVSISKNELNTADFSSNKKLTYLDIGDNPLISVNNLPFGVCVSVPDSTGCIDNWYIYGSTYNGSYQNGAFDLSAIDSNFDSEKVSSLDGATLQGSHLILPRDQEEVDVTYFYDAGSTSALEARLHLTNATYTPVVP